MAALLGLLISQLNTYADKPWEFWLKQVFENCSIAALYFCNIYLLFPKLSHKYWGVLYVISLILAVCLLVWINLMFANLLGIDNIFIKLYSKPGHPYVPNHHWTKTWITALSVLTLALSYVSVIAKRLQKKQLAFEVSEKERIGAELAFLKAQINPHFLFNTLHTIYALMDTNPASAKTSIYSLSHMMRYVLYETKNEQTSLFKEIEFIEDFIALMKVRIAEDVQIIFDKQPGLGDLPLAPMLFLPFIENAFKHGISAVNPSYVYIGISEKDKLVTFEVRNSLFNGLAKQLDDDKGIGVANTRRRLDLIYPGKYDLIAEPDDFAKEFVVTLTLNTNEY
ncbi:sensor histidine kinase [Mucilaginibacter myungsuensis]|uniref:Sensor histidine kinase n=1 Tax=Mucilaginibacter myungsuensis TaxID=649104 RepID=A0A929PY09_9SPHI|nr:sensor histidine kinase [Mucilaginibacter myungsuensis]MBE9662960.1 sensor histidine kinase [Mucilaginibacter myungsuensis]MDN3598588.1 sensor histidine kinase [Mucilaginibacter myungsuensis]